MQVATAVDAGHGQRRTTAVMDTNVFIGAAEIPFREMKDTDIVIPLVVIQEMEHHRSDPQQVGWACRAVFHYLEHLRHENGDDSLTRGVPSYNGNTVRVETDNTDPGGKQVLRDIADGTNDATIIIVASNLADSLGDSADVVLVTNDLPMRIKASMAGLHAVPYGSGETVLRPFSGRYDVSLDRRFEDIEDDDIIDALKANHPDDLAYRAAVDGHALGDDFIALKDGDSISELDQSLHIGNIRPKNIEQQFATSYLLNQDVTVLTLGGIAGAGKSFLTLAAGLRAVQDRRYDKVVVFRSMYEVGQQKVGFLPGGMEEKMAPWADAVWDNVRRIDGISGGRHVPATAGEAQRAHEEDIEVLPISFIRGRTFNDTFVIVDDAQSLELPLLLNILTRLGKNSRVVLTFDMDQQDNPNPHMSTGTSVIKLIDLMKGSDMFAHLDFAVSERSRIAQYASELLRRVGDASMR